MLLRGVRHVKRAFQFKQFKHSIQVYLVAVAEKEITLGSVKRSAPSPTRPVEALEPAHRYVASPAQEVCVVKERIHAEGWGHRPRPSFLKGGTQARDPFVNSVSLCSTLRVHVQAGGVHARSPDMS